MLIRPDPDEERTRRIGPEGAKAARREKTVPAFRGAFDQRKKTAVFFADPCGEAERESRRRRRLAPVGAAHFMKNASPDGDSGPKRNKANASLAGLFFFAAFPILVLPGRAGATKPGHLVGPERGGFRLQFADASSQPRERPRADHQRPVHFHPPSTGPGGASAADPNPRLPAGETNAGRRERIRTKEEHESQGGFGASRGAAGFIRFSETAGNVRADTPAPGSRMTNYLHRGDLPAGFDLGPMVAVDSETMGLVPHRDRLCVVQLSSGDGNAHVIQLERQSYDAPNLKRLLADRRILKIFHFARFDIAAFQRWLKIDTQPVYCTKIASRLARTFTDRHGLKDIARELLGIDLSKQQQSSDWGAETLTDAQVEYAASDVLYLHALKKTLDAMLVREGRAALAEACFAFLPARAALDLAGWADDDILAHS